MKKDLILEIKYMQTKDDGLMFFMTSFYKDNPSNGFYYQMDAISNEIKEVEMNDGDIVPAIFSVSHNIKDDFVKSLHEVLTHIKTKA